MSVNGSRQENQHGSKMVYLPFSCYQKKQILLAICKKQILPTVSKKQILLTVSKKQIFCVSIVSTLLLLAIFPLAKNRHPVQALIREDKLNYFKFPS